MNVLLLNANARAGGNETGVVPPLGLLTVASVLRHAGHEVDFIDADRRDLTVDDLCRETAARRPDVMGITMSTILSAAVTETAAALKEACPGTPIVAGGPHPSEFRGTVLEDCAALDYLVLGEGEETTVELLEVIRAGATGGDLRRVRGIAFRDTTGVVVTEPRPALANVDAIPYPAFDLAMPIDAYPGIRPSRLRPSMAVVTSRGPRHRSVDVVLRELEHTIERFGLREVCVLEEIRTRSRAEALFRGIVRRRLHERTWFRVQLRADEGVVDRELLDRAAEAHVWGVFYEVASGHAGIERVVRRTHEAGIRTTCSFPVGGSAVELARRLWPHDVDLPIEPPRRDAALRELDELYRSSEPVKTRIAEHRAAGLDARAAEVTAALEVLDHRTGDVAPPARFPWEVNGTGLPSTLTLGEDDENSLGGGWYGREQEGGESFRWMGRMARLYVPVLANERIEIDLAPFPGGGNGQPATLTLEIDGMTAGPFAIAGAERRTLAIDVDGGHAESGARRVDLIAGRAVRPCDVDPTNDDTRELSFRLYSVRTTSRYGPEREALREHLADPVSGDEVVWLGAWERRADGLWIGRRDADGSYANVVIRRSDPEFTGAHIALTYRDDAEGVLDVHLLDSLLHPVARRRADLSGSGRRRTLRMPMPRQAACALVLDAHGSVVPIEGVAIGRRDVTRLNLGCGEDVRSGFTNVDLRPTLDLDLRADVAHLPYASESVREILADDIVEHFPWRRTREVLAEWRRVLRPGGILTLRTPSLEGVMKVYRERPTGWRPDDDETDPVVIRLYGGQEYAGNFHHVIFDLRTLRSLLEAGGFEIEELGFDGPDVTNLFAVARRAENAPEESEATTEHEQAACTV